MRERLGKDEFKTVLVEAREKVWRISLNRPEKKNALNQEMYTELHRILDRVEGSTECRVLILTGSGEAFCAGGDLFELSQLTEELSAIQRRLRLSHLFVTRLRGLRQPFITAVNGVAVGAGLSLALAGDLVIAADTARFGATFVRVGLVPDMGSIHTLVHLLGTKKAFELCLMGDVIDAREAEKIGLVNRVVENEKLDEVAAQWAERIVQLPSLQIALLKKAIYKADEINFLSEIEDEINLQSLCLMSRDGKEGLRAFLEKRKPDFDR